jgi:hypothetical protein
MRWDSDPEQAKPTESSGNQPASTVGILWGVPIESGINWQYSSSSQEAIKPALPLLKITLKQMAAKV